MTSTARSDYKDNLVHLFSSPINWNAHRLCKFFNDTYKNIKDIYKRRSSRKGKREKNPPPLIRDVATIKFRENLDEKAKELDLWPQGKTWKHVLGKRFFELLEESTKHMKWFNVENYNKLSVVSLMHLIKDSLSHPDIGKNPEINWYGEVRDESGVTLEFDEFLFVKFWITQFPKLSLFIWNEFKPRRAQLKDFYQGNVDYSEMNNFYTPMEIANCLEKACKEQMEAGHLEGRFKMTTIIKESTQTVEFRPFDDNLHGWILNGSTAVRSVLERDQLFFSWTTNDEVYPPLQYSFPPSNQSGMDVEKVCFVFTNKFGDEHVSDLCILDRWILKAKKVVVFMGSDSLEKAVRACEKNRYFSAYPIEWKEIGESAKQNLKISTQGRKLSLNNLSTQEHSKCEQILCELKGDELNALLKSKQVELLSEYELPEKSKLYVSRRIYNRALVSSKFLSESLPDQIFIIIGCSKEERKKMSAFTMSISSANVFPQLKVGNKECRVFVVEETIDNLESEFSSFVECSMNKAAPGRSTPVHFFRSIGIDRFKLLNASGGGSFSEILTHLKFTDERLGKLSEHEFWESIKSEAYKSDKVFFMAGEPGMGKSGFAKTLAFELGKDKNINKTVLILEMNVFMESLKEKVELTADKNTLKENVVETLCELTCAKGFKSKMFAHLLEKGLISLQLIMDALDEMTPSLKPLMSKVIKAVEEYIPRVQIVVTLREHLLETVMKEFGQLGYALEPFDEVEQEEFLVSFWCKSLGLKRDEITDDVESPLKKFAKECLSKCLSMDNEEIAGIPLQCRIIGEVFVDKVLKKDHKIKDGKYLMSELYEMFLEKKLEVLCREKYGLIYDKEKALCKGIRDRILEDIMALAMKLLFPKFIADLENADAFLQTGLNEDRLELVLEYGLVTDLKSITFLHKTFAEYLTARFIIKKLQSHPHFKDHKNFQKVDPELQKFFLPHLNTAGLLRDYLSRETNVLKFLDMQIASAKLTMKLYENDNVQTKYEEFVKKFVKDYLPPGEEFGYFIESHKNVRKLLLSLPFYGPLVLLLAGTKEFSADEFDYVVSNFDPDPAEWNRLPVWNYHEFGLLHILTMRCTKDIFSPEKLERVHSYIKKVVEKDPDLLEQRDVEGQTPFLFFAEMLQRLRLPNSGLENTNYWKTFSLFLELGADVNKVDNEGNTFLHILMNEGNLHPMTVLLREVEEIVNFIKLIKKKGYSEIINQLNVFNKEGLTPPLRIFCAPFLFCDHDDKNVVYKRLRKIFHDFVECGTNINAADKDADGNPVLLKAIMGEPDVMIIECLVENGAYVGATNKEGKNVVQLEHMHCRKEVYDFFRAKYPDQFNWSDKKMTDKNRVNGIKCYCKTTEDEDEGLFARLYNAGF